MIAKTVRRKQICYLSNKLINKIRLNINNDVVSATRLNLLNQILPSGHISAQLAHPDPKPESLTQDRSSRQFDQILNAVEAVRLLVQDSHVLPLVVVDQVDEARHELIDGWVQMDGFAWQTPKNITRLIRFLDFLQHSIFFF